MSACEEGAGEPSLPKRTTPTSRTGGARGGGGFRVALRTLPVVPPNFWSLPMRHLFALAPLALVAGMALPAYAGTSRSTERAKSRRA